jgi:protein-disulfide isomerase
MMGGQFLAAVAAVAALAGSVRAQEPPPNTLAQRTRGSETAPVTVYELSDFQCPFCRSFTLETFPEIERDYIRTGKVRWIFINFPLTELHPNAAAAAEVGLCAARQDKFWPVHDLLFLHQRVWAPLRDPASFFVSLADSAKLTKPDFQACLADGVTQQEVRLEATGASRATSKTPSFYIEGGMLPGAPPVAVFRAILDSIHGDKTAGRRDGGT